MKIQIYMPLFPKPLNQKIFKQQFFNLIMEMVKIPKSEYEEMKSQISKLKALEKIDFDLVRQFKESLEDVKAGRIRRVA